MTAFVPNALRRGANHTASLLLYVFSIALVHSRSHARHVERRGLLVLRRAAILHRMFHHALGQAMLERQSKLLVLLSTGTTT